MVKRNIVEIDEEKCTGCGLCIPSCAERALQIVDGKARLIKDIYCDGLGACLGECPQDAITIIQREAEEFDEKAAEENVKSNIAIINTDSKFPSPQLCPSINAIHLEKQQEEKTIEKISQRDSRITNWPCQLKLLPSNAPFFQNSDLLITADCVPFAYADFHDDFLRGKILAIGCPKLDNATVYRNKLAEIFRMSNIKSITVVNMEVPCCYGLNQIVKEALGLSGKVIPLREETINIKGKKIT